MQNKSFKNVLRKLSDNNQNKNTFPKNSQISIKNQGVKTGWNT